MENDLYYDSHQQQDDAPASLRVIMLEDAGNPPLPVRGTVGYHTIIFCLSSLTVPLYPQFSSRYQMSAVTARTSVRRQQGVARRPGAPPAPHRRRGWSDDLFTWHHRITVTGHQHSVSRSQQWVLNTNLLLHQQLHDLCKWLQNNQFFAPNSAEIKQ